MKKSVRFDDSKTVVHFMHVWLYASKAARKGEWEQAARDRERFKMRVRNLAPIIEPVLAKKL